MPNNFHDTQLCLSPSHSQLYLSPSHSSLSDVVCCQSEVALLCVGLLAVEGQGGGGRSAVGGGQQGGLAVGTDALLGPVQCLQWLRGKGMMGEGEGRGRGGA